MIGVGIETLRLESDALAIDVLAGKGADIYTIIDKASGVDVMFKTPWGLRDPRGLPPRADSGRVARALRRWVAGAVPQRR